MNKLIQEGISLMQGEYNIDKEIIDTISKAIQKNKGYNKLNKHQRKSYLGIELIMKGEM